MLVGSAYSVDINYFYPLARLLVILEMMESFSLMLLEFQRTSNNTPSPGSVFSSPERMASTMVSLMSS